MNGLNVINTWDMHLIVLWLENAHTLMSSGSQGHEEDCVDINTKFALSPIKSLPHFSMKDQIKEKSVLIFTKTISTKNWYQCHKKCFSMLYLIL